MDLLGELAILGEVVRRATLRRLEVCVCLLKVLPLTAHILNLRLPIKLGIIRLANTPHALPQAEMLGVDSYTVVLVGTAAGKITPATLLLFEIKTGGVREEDPGKQHAGKAKPGNDVELGLSVDVVVENRSEQGTSLADAGRETVSSGANGGGKDLSRNKEGHRVGSELVEEGREEVHGLEGVNAGRAGVVLVVKSWNDKHEEAHEKSNLLHCATAVELVVDEKGGQVVSCKRDSDVDQVPGPCCHKRVGVGRDNLDELSLEQLVAVEEDVIAEPGTSGSQQTTTKVLETVPERVNIVACDLGARLGLSKLLGSMGHFPGTVVCQPGRADSREGEGQAEAPLSGRLGVGRTAVTGVEDDQQDNKENLVDELAPTLHEESHGDTATAVKAILAGRELASGNCVFEG